MTSTHLHDYRETSRNWLAPQRKGQKWREVIAYKCDVPGCRKPRKTVKGRARAYKPEGA
jgi:hypothetical protein